MHRNQSILLRGILGGAFTVAAIGTAHANVVNGGFEGGSLSGWQTSGYVQAVGTSYFPSSGANAALITTGGSTPDYTLRTFTGAAASLDSLGLGDATAGSAIKQSIDAAAGITLSFDWNFVCNDYVPYNDFAGVVIDGQIYVLSSVANCDGRGGPTPLFQDETGWATFSHTFATSGTHTVAFFVTDVRDSSVDSGILIDNIHFANEAPVAICESVTLEANDECLATGSIDGGTFDPDGDAFTTSEAPAGPYGLGSTNVTLTATDAYGASATCVGAVTVVDVTAPQAEVGPMVTIYPYDYSMLSFSLSDCAAITWDNCDASADINALGQITSISSDEPDQFSWHDADPGSDIVITSNSSFAVRNQRNSFGDGRVYRVSFTVADSAGNASQEYTCEIGIKLYDDGGCHDTPLAGPACFTVYADGTSLSDSSCPDPGPLY